MMLTSLMKRFYLKQSSRAQRLLPESAQFLKTGSTMMSLPCRETCRLAGRRVVLKFFGVEPSDFFLLVEVIFSRQSFGLCVTERQRSDVVALKPTSDELREAREWLIPLDGNPLWSDHVDQTLNEVDRSMGLEHKHD